MFLTASSFKILCKFINAIGFGGFGRVVKLYMNAGLGTSNMFVRANTRCLGKFVRNFIETCIFEKLPKSALKIYILAI